MQTTQQAQAAFALEAERRWCLTGTPLSNRVEDLFSLVKFVSNVVFVNSLWLTTVLCCVRKL